MRRNVKISVLMGVHNPRRERLERAVSSVIGQTMEEWELILCDDGSDSSYTEMIRETAETDERIHCIKNEQNRGLAYTLNRCMKQAKGQYFARMDDDDESRPERFRKQYEFLEAYPEYGWVGSGAELFADGKVWGVRSVPEKPEAKDFLCSSPYIHPSVMFRRKTLEKNQGYISAEVTRRCEDYELFMRLHARGCRGYNIQETLLRYRDDADTWRRRLPRYRVNEMKIRYRGFCQLGILKAATVPYVIRPLAGAVVPLALMRYIHRHKKEINTEGYQ